MRQPPSPISNSRERPMASLRLRIVAVLGGCWATLLSVGVFAQTTAAERAAHMAGLRIDRSMLAGPLADSPRSAMRLSSNGEFSAGPETREMKIIGSGVVLEMPRVEPDGSFRRPRVLIGRQSPELHAWMREAGLAPERCMLPLFRGRLKREQETGKVGMAVLVSARCTFY